MYLKLNGIEVSFEVKDTSTVNRIIVPNIATIGDVDIIRENLNDNSLKKFEFTTETGDVMGVYENYKSTGKVEYFVNEDGTYEATYLIEEKSDVEVRLDKLEEEQELQNGAIDELASVVGGE